MPRTDSVAAHPDAIKAVAFCTGLTADQINGYVVIAIMHDGDSLITSNGVTKAATVALIAGPLSDLAYEVATDLAGVLLG